MQAVARNGNLTKAIENVRASRLSELSFPDKVRAEVLGTSVNENRARSLIPKLLEIAKKYREEDEAYIATKQKDALEEIGSFLSASAERRKQREKALLDDLTANPSLQSINSIGKVIDDRWGDVISPRKVPTSHGVRGTQPG
jgi:hypothetical protein